MKSPKVTYDQALDLLKSGKVVAIPTETVYGLAGRIDNQKTLEDIFTIKKRPSFDPLIVHCYDALQAKKYISGDSHFIECLWDRFSPGPLTVVVPKNNKILPIITANQDTVALRIPKHPLVRNLLKHLNIPLAAPSANLYSKLSPTKADDVVSIFLDKVPVLDGGDCEVGLESTIVQPDLKNKKIFILRPGIITKKDFQVFLKDNEFDFSVADKKDSPQPGGQTEHYQPDVPLFLVESEREDSQIISFLKSKYPESLMQKLSLEKSPHTLARYLYSDLRKLSQEKNSIIFVVRTKNQEGEAWQAIWDRLEKASSKKFNLK